MTVHARVGTVRLAELELRESLKLIVAKNQLTEGEEILIASAVLCEVIHETSKYLIRQERHGNRRKPGGVQ